MRVSYSALNTYKTCPLKFKYQTLDKIKTPKSVEAVFGTIVHSILKRIFERTPLYPTIDELINIFSDVWYKSVKEIENLPPEHTDAHFKEGVTIIKNFYKKNLPWNFNPLELESFFGVPIKDEKNGEEHILSGIIDRIDKDPKNDTYEIIDYKTAKRIPSQDILDKDLQLSIYNLGLLKKWPHIKPENIKLSLYFLKHNEKIQTQRNPEDLENTKKEILEIINEIENIIGKEEEFIPTPSALCDWCGYQKKCPMFMHLYAKDKEKIDEKEVENLINQYLSLKEQNSQNNKQIKALQGSINAFMDQEHIERVFGENGYLTRVLQERTSFDNAKMKKALQDAGLWDEPQFVKKTSYKSLKIGKK